MASDGVNRWRAMERRANPPSSRRAGNIFVSNSVSSNSVTASTSGLDLPAGVMGDVVPDAACGVVHNSCSPVVLADEAAARTSWALRPVHSDWCWLTTGGVKKTRCARPWGCPGVASAPQQTKGMTRPKMPAKA